MSRPAPLATVRRRGRTDPLRSPVSANRLTALAQAVDAGDAGWGSVALAPIPAGHVVATFGGTPCRLSVLRELPAERASRSIQIDDDLFLAGPPEREPGDCVNHSCDPNCGPRGAATIVARRPIEPGEPLSFDYATTDGSDYDEFDCACGTTACRGRVRGTDWRLASVRERHRVAMSPYLLRRLRTEAHGRPLRKSEVESLLAAGDDGAQEAVATALRVVLARPWSTWTALVDGLRLEGGIAREDADALIAGDVDARDALVMRLVEGRGADVLAAFSGLPG